MECKSKMFVRYCGCILYYLPKLNDNTSICTGGDNECIKYVSLEIEIQLDKDFVCNCLPACFEVIV